MLSGSTIHGKLTLINLLVTSVLLWLTISFWYDAFNQRNDASHIQQSVVTDSLMLDATRRLSYERDFYNELLNASNSTSPSALVALRELSALTTQIFRTTEESLEQLISEQSFVSGLHYPIEVLNQKRHVFQTLELYLETYREYAQEQLSHASGNRDATIKGIIFNAYTDVIKSLRILSSTIQLTPKHRTEQFVVLQDLKSSIWDMSIETSLEASMLNDIVIQGEFYQNEDQPNLELLENSIRSRWKRIIRLKDAKSKSVNLNAKIDSVFEFYDFNIEIAKSQLFSTIQSTEYGVLDKQNWRTISGTLINDIYSLGDMVNSEIHKLAEDSRSHGTRRLIIDTLLLVFCVGIALVSLGLTRRIKHQAHHDQLTGLPNRLYFVSHLMQLIRTSSSVNRNFSVIRLDIDKLKSINDTFGQQVGNNLIIAMSSRIKSLCDDTCVLARIGGGEFALLHKAISAEAQSLTLTERLLDALSEDFELNGITLRICTSAGISSGQTDGDNAEELLINADIAMSRSKTNSQQKIHFYDKTLATNFQQRVQTEIELRAALEQSQLELYYQPKVSTQTNTCTSLEALIRWNHPQRGLVSPAEFIPIAEESGLLRIIGSWVLNEACRQVSQWNNEGLTGMTIAVNISAQQFGDPDFVNIVCDSLAKFNVPPAQLELEITESIVMADVETVIEMLNRLRSYGLSIALDDFGTGYSSLQYLQKLPLNTLKIDRAFVTDLDNRNPGYSMANTIVQLANLLDLQTVAEGVETVEQLDKITGLGVDYIQGYYYSKPLPASEVREVVENLFKPSDEYLKAV